MARWYTFRVYLVVLFYLSRRLNYGDCCQPGQPQGVFQSAYPKFSAPAIDRYQQLSAPIGANTISSQPLPLTAFIADQPTSGLAFRQNPQYISSARLDPPSSAIIPINSVKNFLEEAKFRSTTISKHSRCSQEVLTLGDFYACMKVRPFNDDAEVASGGSLTCGFELPSLCSFYSSPEESIQWKRGRLVGSGTEFEETFAAMMNRPVGYSPRGDFVFVGETSPRSGYGSAILKSHVPCQQGDGRLSFDFWKSDPNVHIKVCTRTEDSRSCTQKYELGKELNLRKFWYRCPYHVMVWASNLGADALTINYNDSSPVEVNVIHPNVTPFAIEIIVSSVTEPSILIIDNLSYEADLCTMRDAIQLQTASDNSLQPISEAEHAFFGDDDSLVDFETEIALHRGKLLEGREIKRVQPLSSRTLLPIRRLKACEILKCDFDFGLCNFRNAVERDSTGRFGRWEVAEKQKEDVHTGIRKYMVDWKRRYTQGYAYVGDDTPDPEMKGHRTYILESQMFTLDNDSVLTFDLYRRSTAITLNVCLDNINNCVYEAADLETGVFWKRNEAVRMPKTTRKVYFVATQWNKFKWLAMDNVSLNYDAPCSAESVTERV